MIYQKFIKRPLDFVISSLMLLLLSPIFLLLFVILGLYHKSSPFFTQPRPGKNGKIFFILKFKTMLDSYDEQGHLLSDEERITELGKVIRKSSLDEIPQLLNVLRGDMSMVGPRPLLIEYLNLYSDEQHKRHDIKPGVTGWAQINGRNGISWEQKFKYDIWYIDNCSLALDIKILFSTFFNVLSGKGISQEGHISMKKFTGNSTKDYTNQSVL
ncbi:sugar transferase [Algoriphagus sp. SE2]|uniref:sugar transferase n=1 Tax=Algoriphagus sp. SE2 TaxID=3141536 RepID=UPI0031CD9F4B